MKYIEHVHEPRRLLLIWQGPEGSTRSRHAVAELVRTFDERVQFRYLTGSAELDAAQNEGFINFPAFRKLEQTYDLGVVETFMRRLPPRTRGDYGQYLEQFRLRSETRITEFALLAYTGAKLPSDGFSILNPLEDVLDSCDVLLEVAGFRHAAELSPSEIHEGDIAVFQPEPGNIHDPNAVAILVRGRKIGFVPRQQTLALRQWLKSAALEVAVERVNGRPERPLVYVFVRARLSNSLISPARYAG